MSTATTDFLEKVRLPETRTRYNELLEINSKPQIEIPVTGARQLLGMSVRDFAHALTVSGHKVSRAMISHIENNRREASSELVAAIQRLVLIFIASKAAK